MKHFSILIICICLSIPVLATAQTRPVGAHVDAETRQNADAENGAVQFYINYGASFGTPGARAAVGNTISPERNRLSAPGAGVSVRWRYLVPFFELTAMDVGSAWAQVGSVRSEVNGAEAATFHGGVRVESSSSSIRPFAKFSIGTMRETLNEKFIVSGISNSRDITASTGSLYAGGGVDFFFTPRAGMMVGFDVGHVGQQMQNGKQNYGRVYIGYLFQTKSSLQRRK